MSLCSTMLETKDMFLSVVFLVVVTAVPLDRADEDNVIKNVAKAFVDEKLVEGANQNKRSDILTLFLKEDSPNSRDGHTHKRGRVPVHAVVRNWKNIFKRDVSGNVTTNGRNQFDNHTVDGFNSDNDIADDRFEKLKHAKHAIWKHHRVLNTERKSQAITRFLLKKLAQTHVRLFHSQTNPSVPHGQDVKTPEHRADESHSRFIGMTDIRTDHLDCLYLHFYHKRWIKMIGSCPRSLNNNTLRAQCEDGRLDKQDRLVHVGSIPVQLKNGLVFRNLFCAVCNGIKKIEAWDVNLACTGIPPVNFIDRGADFMLLGEPKDGRLQCRKTLVPTIKDKVEFCQITKRRRSYPQVMLNNELSKQPTDTLAYPVSFSILMNFGFDGRAHILFSTSYKEVDYTDQPHICPETQVYNPEFGMCQRVVCPPGYVFSDFLCVTDSTTKVKPSTSLDEELRELDKPEIIKLRANISESELEDLKDVVYLDFVKAAMCEVLNITCDRIKNFTMVPLLGGIKVTTTEYTNTIEPRTQPIGYSSPIQSRRRRSEDVSEPMHSTVISNPVSHGIPLTTVPNMKPPHTEMNSRTSDSPIFTTEPDFQTTKYQKLSTQKSTLSKKAFSKTSSPKSSSSEVSTKTTLTSTPTTVVSTPRSSILTSTIKVTLVSTLQQPTTAQNLNKPQDNQTVVVEIRFVITPLEKDIGHGEGFVNNVTQRMKDRIDQNTFTLSLNGTRLHVLTMDQVSSVVQMDTFCTRGIKQMYFDDEFVMLQLPKDNDTVDVVYVNKTKTQYWPGMYDLTVLVAGSVLAMPNITHKSKYVFVCVMPRIANSSCGRLNFTQDDYVLLSNKSILLFNRTYSMDEYYLHDEAMGNIEICIPEEFYKHHKQNRFVIHACGKGYEYFQKAEGYLTAILGRMSIVALTMVLLTYILIKPLRNLPGVNTMNLTFAILVSQVIFILGENSELQWLCSLVAVSLHYFILASFFWMNVMTFDVFKTFATKCILTQIRSRSKYMWRYSLYAWGSPLVIVLICAFVDFSGLVRGFQIGYGGWERETNTTDMPNNLKTDGQNNSRQSSDVNSTDSHVNFKENKNLGCWIQNPVATLIVFGGPLLTIFIVNGFLFIRTILCIQETARLAHINTRRSSMSHKTGRYHVMLYVRMSTVMGFTWIFGLASSIVSGSKAPPSEPICYTVHALGILFTVFNCSQGLFILFAFVAKRRVLHMYKNLLKGFVLQFKKWKEGKSKTIFGRPSSTSSSSSSTTSISHIT